MGMFTKTPEEITKLSEEIAQLTVAVNALKKEKAGRENIKALQDERDKLREEINDLAIDKSKIVEQNEREKREVEHKVGLDRKRAEQELVLAKQEITLNVREENLQHEKEQFDKQMQFQKEEFSRQVEYMQDILKSILERLPNVNVSSGRATLANGIDDAS